jgi:hypothetical protein
VLGRVLELEILLRSSGECVGARDTAQELRRSARESVRARETAQKLGKVLRRMREIEKSARESVREGEDVCSGARESVQGGWRRMLGRIVIARETTQETPQRVLGRMLRMRIEFKRVSHEEEDTSIECS